MTSLKFSVLLPIYHGDKTEYVKEAIASIINQTKAPDEVVIVYDGEVSREIKEYVFIKSQSLENIQMKIIDLQQNRGLGEALRIGVENCKYDIIARMDADDISQHDRFEKQITYFCKYNELDVVGSYIAEFESDTQKIVSIRKVPTSHDEIYEYMKKRNPFNHMTVMFKKAAVIRADSYVHMPYFEDYYLWVRMALNGATMKNIPEVLVLSRAGESMYNRRGGIKYLRHEVNFQRKLLQMGFIGKSQFLINVLIRGVVRIIPNRIRKFVYITSLRK
jgi:glycosyltransferase involved in cell wall biosynthesis